MSELWQVAAEASDRFAAQVLQYDRCRPRYPAGVFEDIVASAQLRPGDRAIEVGAGTGIATEPLVEQGLAVTAVEPAAALASIAESKLAGRARFVVSRFEDLGQDSSVRPVAPVRLLTAFNAWHWLDPRIAADLAAQLIEPGGSLALVWTEVVSWGQAPFEERLVETFGSRWEKRTSHLDRSMQPVVDDPRFGYFREFHHVFERVLDGPTFVKVTQTYGGDRSDVQYGEIERIINGEFGGAITKVEDAVVYLSARL